MEKPTDYRSIAIDFGHKNLELNNKVGSLEIKLKIATEALEKIKTWNSEENDEHENLEYFVSEILNKLNQ